MFERKRQELKNQLIEIDAREEDGLKVIADKVEEYEKKLIAEFNENQEMDRNEVNLKLEFLEELEQEEVRGETQEEVVLENTLYNPSDVNGNL